MTTIAWDGRTLAADTMSSSDSGSLQIRKIRRTPDGRLIGAAGASSRCEAFMDWLEGRVGPMPSFQDDEDDCVHAIEITPAGGVTLYERHGSFEVLSSPVALGSGGAFARGAMEAGANAVTAVIIAARCDNGTGLSVDVLERDSVPAHAAPCATLGHQTQRDTQPPDAPYRRQEGMYRGL